MYDKIHYKLKKKKKNLAVSRETFSTVVLKVKAVLLLYSRDSKMEGCALLYIFSSK